MADSSPTPAALGPYRNNPRPPHVHRPRRRRHPLRSPVARTLFAPLYIGVVLSAALAITFGSINISASRQGLFITPSAATVEDRLALALVATIPLVAFALFATCKRFPAPRPLKRRYTGRALAMHTFAVAIGVVSLVGTRPPDADLLASTSRTDGREAYLYGLKWGCGYRLRVSIAQWGMAKEISALGPFQCDAPLPRIAWRGEDVTLIAANDEIIGTWAAAQW